MAAIVCIKEGSLGSEPPGGAVEAAATILLKWLRASGMATVLVANVSPPA